MQFSLRVVKIILKKFIAKLVFFLLNNAYYINVNLKYISSDIYYYSLNTFINLYIFLQLENYFHILVY